MWNLEIGLPKMELIPFDSLTFTYFFLIIKSMNLNIKYYKCIDWVDSLLKEKHQRTKMLEEFCKEDENCLTDSLCGR